MTSSMQGERSLSFAENGDVQIKSDISQEPHQSRMDLFRSKFLGSDPRSCAGMCMVAFAIPLLIPGITLTVVVFEDEKGFSKYSALHIIGMILLAVAIVLIVVGLVLCIHCSSKVSPDDVPQNVSTHEKSVQNLDISDRFNSKGSYTPHLGREIGSSSKIPVAASYYVTQGNSTATEGIGKSVEHVGVGSLPPSFLHSLPAAPEILGELPEPGKNTRTSGVMDYYSSSSGSLDSDMSSASYSIHESCDEAGNETPLKISKSRSPRINPKTFNWDLAASIQGNMPCPISSVNPSNFDLKSKTFFDWGANGSPNPNLAANSTIAQFTEDNNRPDASDALEDDGGPALRQRLYAVSGDQSRPTSDAVTQPPMRHSGHSEDQNSSMSESSSSVFRVDSVVLTNEIIVDSVPPRNATFTSNQAEESTSTREKQVRHLTHSSAQPRRKEDMNRPQSDGLVRQVHVCERTNANSWHGYVLSKPSENIIIESDHRNESLTEKTFIKTTKELPDNVSDSLTDSLQCISLLDTTSKETRNIAIGTQASVSESLDAGPKSANIKTHEPIVHPDTTPVNLTNQQPFHIDNVGGFKISESSGVITQDTANNDLYTSSLRVFSS
uniref:Uncharacterized protein n=1 Tax=Biomphalaria glabrata TaxID=6526 RepID=A0A2C9LJT5_BIOGL